MKHTNIKSTNNQAALKKKNQSINYLKMNKLKIMSMMIGFMSISTMVAQEGKVGVGNTDPKATLDVTGTPATATAADGIIAPRLTGDQLAAKNAVYNAAQTGAQVYVTAAATTPAGKTINVTAPGYYYFDGAVWQKVANKASKFVDGTTATDAVYTEGNVGIGIALPLAKLDVRGTNFIFGSDTVGDLPTFNALVPSAGTFSFNSTSAGGAFAFSRGGSETMRIAGNGNVGIGTDTPSQKLHVSGGALVSSLAGTGSRMVVADETGVLSTQAFPAAADGSETKVNAGTNVTVTGAGTTASPYVVNSAIETATQTPSTAIAASGTQVAVASTNVQGAIADLATAVKTAGNNLYTADGTLAGNRTVSQGANNLTFTGTGNTILNSGNVGIGIALPLAKLDVRGTNFIFGSGTVGDLPTFTALVPSAGTFSFNSTSAGGAFAFSRGGSETMRIAGNGNVGIGTDTPSQKLHVVGGALVSSLAGTGSRMVVADETGVLSTQTIPAGATADGSETKVNAGTGISVTGSGTVASPYVVSQAPLAVTVPSTNDYTVLDTDAIIYRTLTANGTITFPSTLPAGKVFYVSNNSASFDWSFFPTPINTGAVQIFAGYSHMVVTLGGGQIMVVSGN